MKEPEIRSKDKRLKNALTCWFEEFGDRIPGSGPLILTDLDSMPAAEVPHEITISRTLPCTLPRPFSFEELEAVLLLQPTKVPRLIFTDKAAFLYGKELSLSPLEEKILRLLAEATEPLGARELSLALWGEKRPSNQINVYIRYLRKKTDLAGKERLIHTLRGKGFYLKND